MPSGPGMIEEALIAKIAASVPPPVATFLLTSETHPHKIIEQQRQCGTNTLQLCDHLPRSTQDQIREALPGIKLVQVVHVENEESIKYAISAADHVDALLLDSGNLSGSVKEFGGTGRTHDWNLSRKIRDGVPIPVFLAGGLSSSNVAKAIETVEPFGVDLCSSVRTKHLLDISKLETFFRSVPKIASNLPN